MGERGRRGEEQDAVVVDPVCGVPLLVGDEATVSLDLCGRTFRFCSQACCGHFARLAEQALLEQALRAGRLLAPRARPRWGAA